MRLVQKRGIIYLMSVIMMFAVVLSACGGNNTTNNSGSGGNSGTNGDVAQPTPTPAQKVDLRFMSAPPGGDWYIQAEAVSKVLQDNVAGLSVSATTGGAASNPIGVQSKQGDLGFSLGSTTAEAYNGLATYDEKNPDIRMIVTFFKSYVQWVALQSSNIYTVDDLVGKTTSGGPKGLISEFVATEMFKTFGYERDKDVTISNLGFQDSVEAMGDNQIDAMTITPSFPYMLFVNAAHSKPIRYVKFDEARIDQFVANNPGFLKDSIPQDKLNEIYGAGTADADYITASTPQTLFANKDMSEETAYNITKAIVENIEELGKIIPPLAGLTAEDLYTDFGVPYHDGALKYFKEIGVAK